MKVFAHRGWSSGHEENTISAFKKSHEGGVDGVELDIRLDSDGRSVVVSHDMTSDASVLTLDEALSYLKETNLEILIELKEYNARLYEITVELLRLHNLANRSVIFAFPEIAVQFPWKLERDFMLGIISPYPSDLRKHINAYNPDVVLLGWGNNRERMKFKIVWSILSLRKTFAKYPSQKFIIGVAFENKDKQWLERHPGLYGITADFPLE